MPGCKQSARWKGTEAEDTGNNSRQREQHAQNLKKEHGKFKDLKGD